MVKCHCLSMCALYYDGVLTDRSHVWWCMRGWWWGGVGGSIAE